MTKLQQNYILIFVSGLAIGGLSTWSYTKTYYKKVTNEKLEIIRNHYKKKQENMVEISTEHLRWPPEEPVTLSNASEEDMTDYIQKAVDYLSNSPIDYSHIEAGVLPKEKIVEDTPYEISSDEFGEFDDYECITLTYFLDEVLVDDQYQILDDPIELVGDISSIEHDIGEFAEDCVYIRNDAKHCDFEVIYALETYKDYIQKHPTDNIPMMIPDEEEE